MRKVTVFNFVTLNGYFEGPKGDTSWHMHGAEESEYAVEMLKSGDTLLFGRVTYEFMASYWPTPDAIKNDPIVAEGMNKADKIVFSRSLKKVEWGNTRLVKDNIEEEVEKMKQMPGKNMTLLGSGSIVTQLAQQGLIDEYQIMVDPVVLGDGTSIFKGIKHKLDLRLTRTRTFIMAKLPEPEGLATLRRRWARTIEIWVAYRTFLHREVLVGPDRICLTPVVVQQTTHTLLACYYSFLYSLFDPSGVNFDRVSKELLPQLPARASEVRDRILEHWTVIAEPVTLIRHNIGFHGAPKRKGMRRGYAAYRSLHPQSSEYVMTLMRVFFRLVDEAYTGAERRMHPTAPGEIDSLLAMASKLRSEIDATPAADTFKELAHFFGWSNGVSRQDNGDSSGSA